MIEKDAQSSKALVTASLVRLVQAGVFVPLTRPCSVYAFLRSGLGVVDDFILSRIQTIILNSKVVDDMGGAWLLPGSRLALSAAMPGVVGAALRRNGLFARLREGIRCPVEERQEKEGSFWLELRLYNSMIGELALPLLACGFAVPESRLPEVLVPFLHEAPFFLPAAGYRFVRTATL